MDEEKIKKIEELKSEWVISRSIQDRIRNRKIQNSIVFIAIQSRDINLIKKIIENYEDYHLYPKHIVSLATSTNDIEFIKSIVNSKEKYELDQDKIVELVLFTKDIEFIKDIVDRSEEYGFEPDNVTKLVEATNDVDYIKKIINEKEKYKLEPENLFRLKEKIGEEATIENTQENEKNDNSIKEDLSDDVPKDKLIMNDEEINAIEQYTGEYYNAINVLLSPSLTTREKVGSYEKTNIDDLLSTPEEFKKCINSTLLLYSVIKKNYFLNASRESHHTLFRGTRLKKDETSFLSTSSKMENAFDFLYNITSSRNLEGKTTIFVLDSNNVPCINIHEFFPKSGAYKEDDENEILFVPSEIKEMEEISFSDCLDIDLSLGNQGMAKRMNKSFRKEFGNLKCYKAKLHQKEYQDEKTNVTIDELCEKFQEYKDDLKVIRKAEEGSEEYKRAYANIIEFKTKYSSFVHQKFHEIDMQLDKVLQGKKEFIKLSDDIDTKEVNIGNTGLMYQVTDKQNGEEYYFKPAISKGGEARPYRAIIQEAAYELQKIINPENAVRCNTIYINGKFGAIQEKIKIDEKQTQEFQEYFSKNSGKLSPGIIKQIMKEYLVDYCLCNYDSHCRNFVIDKNGNLRGIDKEQAFRYIKDDANQDMKFTHNYNEKYGEMPSIYSTIFKKIESSEIPIEVLDELKFSAIKLAQYPDSEYRKIFEGYAKGKTSTPLEAEQLLDEICSRKENIIQKVEELRNEVEMNKKRQEKANKVEQKTKVEDQPVMQDEKSNVRESGKNEQQEEGIKDKGEDVSELKKTEQEKEKFNDSTTDVWVNRFCKWYGAIDRVKPDSKVKFVKMKSAIIKAIREKSIEQGINKNQDQNER